MRSTGVSSSFRNPASTTSPRKSVWPPQSTVLVDPAVEVGRRLREDGRTGRAVDVGEAVERAGGEIDLDGLGELPHDGPVLAVDHAQAEHAGRGHELVGEGLLLDADGQQLRLEAHLRRPVQGHPVAALAAVGRADHVQPGRHRPQHPRGAAGRTRPWPRRRRSPRRGRVRQVRCRRAWPWTNRTPLDRSTLPGGPDSAPRQLPHPDGERTRPWRSPPTPMPVGSAAGTDRTSPGRAALDRARRCRSARDLLDRGHRSSGAGPVGVVPGRARRTRRAGHLPARAVAARGPVHRPRRRGAPHPRAGGRAGGPVAAGAPRPAPVAERVLAAPAERAGRGAGQPRLRRRRDQPHLRDHRDPVRRRPRHPGEPCRPRWGARAAVRIARGGVPPARTGLRLQGRRPGVGRRPPRGAPGRDGPAGRLRSTSPASARSGTPSAATPRWSGAGSTHGASRQSTSTAPSGPRSGASGLDRPALQVLAEHAEFDVAAGRRRRPGHGPDEAWFEAEKAITFGGWATVDERARPGRTATIAGARHLSFMDVPFLPADDHAAITAMLASVTIAPERMWRVTSDLVLAFFAGTSTGSRPRSPRRRHHGAPRGELRGTVKGERRAGLTCRGRSAAPPDRARCTTVRKLLIPALAAALALAACGSDDDGGSSSGDGTTTVAGSALALDDLGPRRARRPTRATATRRSPSRCRSPDRPPRRPSPTPWLGPSSSMPPTPR